ncbi:Glyco hydro 30 domain containing protein, partial [Asbolus verrucosus]
SYFSEDGLEYNLCRVPMGASDYSTHAYTYDDGETDEELTNFRLAPEDFQFKIPHIKSALNLSNGNLQLFASAWIAPIWMKVLEAGKRFKLLQEEMYQPWANYFVKFLDNYRKEGIEFWGITTGNEPTANAKIGSVGEVNSVAWSSSQMMLLNNNFTREYVDGIAMHSYYNKVSLIYSFADIPRKFPENFILATESPEVFNSLKKKRRVDLGSWDKGEVYTNYLMENILIGIVGSVTLNMALDLKGGPTYAGSSLHSTIIVNATADEFYKQPMYYQIAHFSKFIPKGSVQIYSSKFNSDVPVVAFKRPDNGTVVVILNKKEEVVPVAVVDRSRGAAELELSAKSITTLLYW